MKTPLLIDVMTQSPLYVEADVTIEGAKALMEQHNIRHLPVMENGVLEGILSERDIKYASLPGHRPTADDQLSVADLCPTRAYIADINDPLNKVVEIMAQQNIAEVIVLKDGELAGIYTDSDCCKVLSELLKTQTQ
jgi:acetoin utilization protein AcuB